MIGYVLRARVFAEINLLLEGVEASPATSTSPLALQPWFDIFMCGRSRQRPLRQVVRMLACVCVCVGWRGGLLLGWVGRREGGRHEVRRAYVKPYQPASALHAASHASQRYAIGRYESDEELPSWISRCETTSAVAVYTCAFHWSLTQFTPATQNLSPVSYLERFFACFVVLVALVTFSTFLGKMTSGMSQLLSLHADRQQQETMLRQFMGDLDGAHSGAAATALPLCMLKACAHVVGRALVERSELFRCGIGHRGGGGGELPPREPSERSGVASFPRLPHRLAILRRST